MANIFERASKQKLRFSTSKGQLSTEDLWDLSLPSLDVLAKAINKALKDSDEESFISEKTTINTELNLKMDILKHIIAHKLELKDRAKRKAQRDEELAALNDLLADKTKEELKSLSKEEIAKKIAKLKEEE